MSGWFWIFSGLVLIFLEFLLPGMIVVFLGISAVVTGLIVLTDLIPSLSYQLFLWVVLSGVLVVFFREQLARLFPGLERKDYTPEEDEPVSGTGLALTPIDDRRGRIRFRESSWEARSVDGRAIEANQRVEIVTRDGFILIVRPAPEIQSEI